MKPKGTASIQDLPPCVEHGLWTPIPVPPPKKKLRLRLKDVDAKEARRIAKSGVMSFHLAGCSGSHENHVPQKAVADAMARQLRQPGIWGGQKKVTPSFFFHLGDIVYKGEMPEDATRNHQPKLCDEQFYGPYAGYDRSIFAIAGNHDGKHNEDPKKSAIDHFLGNFCARLNRGVADAPRHGRAPMNQPYPYWALESPAAYIIGLYGNVINAGQLDDPMGKNTPQYDWLVRALTRIREKKSGKAVLLAVHYPPYSGARDFVRRGDPNIGPTPRRVAMQPLAVHLRRAFRESGQYPDAIVSAHAHNYQRLTYRYANGREIPCFIVGTGGHNEIEPVDRTPAGKRVKIILPSAAVLPPGFKLPKGDSATLVSCQDAQPGFLRLTLSMKSHELTMEYFRVPCFGSKAKPSLYDSVRLDMKKHRLGKTDERKSGK